MLTIEYTYSNSNIFMNKILIVAGLILVAVVFFILGIRIMMPNDEGNSVPVTTETATQPESVHDTAVAPEIVEDDGPKLDVVQSPTEVNVFLFSLNEPVEVKLPDCNNSLFPAESPYVVDFGDGQTGSLAAHNTGFAIESGYCSLFWEVSHKYSAEGAYAVKLLKDGTIVSTTQAVLGSDLR